MSLLDRVLGPDPGPYALLHRPGATGPDELELLVGDVCRPASLADIPLRPASAPDAEPGHEVLAVVPYRQIAERGFSAADDGAPLIALPVTGQERGPLARVLAAVPDVPTVLTGAHFDIDDEEYARTVRRVVTESIGTGEGANFVIKRSFVADIPVSRSSSRRKKARAAPGP